MAIPLERHMLKLILIRTHFQSDMSIEEKEPVYYERFTRPSDPLSIHVFVFVSTGQQKHIEEICSGDGIRFRPTYVKDNYYNQQRF